MKANERDDLLIRLDERTANIWRVTEEQGRHLKELNGEVREVAVIKEGMRNNHRRINWIMWVIGSLIVGGGGAMGVISLL